MAGIVNLIMHGVYGYIFRPDHIEVVTPAVCRHIYRAGGIDYTNAKPLNPQRQRGVTYTLSGVSGTTQRPAILDPLLYPLLVNFNPDPVDEFKKSFCKFNLPYPQKVEEYPKQIYPLDAYEVGSIYAGKDMEQLNDMSACPSLLAFVYPWDGAPVKLTPDPAGDEIVFDVSSNNSDVVMLNAHIWCTLDPAQMGNAASGHMKGDGHLRRAFSALVDLLPNLELTFQFPDGFSPTEADEGRPPGVSPCDVDPGRKGCPPIAFGKVNCHYANLVIWPAPHIPPHD